MDLRKLIEEATNNYVSFYHRIHLSFVMDLYFLYGVKPNISHLHLPLESLPGTPLYIEASHTAFPYCIVGLTAELPDRRVSIYEQVLYNFYDKAVHKVSSVYVVQTAKNTEVTVIAPEKTAEQCQKLEENFLSIIPKFSG